MPLDPLNFRRAMGQFSTGITVVSCRDLSGKIYGVTVNSFNSVSLNPPLALFSLGLEGASTPAFLNASEYGVSILAEGQEGISKHFAQATADKWFAIAHDILENLCPVVQGSLVNLTCRRHAIHEGGDHRIVVVEVVKADFNDAATKPLLYFRGQYQKLI